MTQKHYPAALLVVISATIALAGCNSSGLLHQRAAARRTSIEWTVSTRVARESGGWQRVDRACRFVESDVTRHARLLERDAQVFGQRLEWNANRWTDRQPDYRRQATHILAGKPERIERTAILLFY